MLGRQMRDSFYSPLRRMRIGSSLVSVLRGLRSSSGKRIARGLCASGVLLAFSAAFAGTAHAQTPILSAGNDSPISLAAPGAHPTVINHAINLSIEKQNIWTTQPLNFNKFYGHEWDESQVLSGSLDGGFFKADTDLHLETHGRAGLQVEAKTQTPTLDMTLDAKAQTTITKINPTRPGVNYGRNASAFKIETSVSDTKINADVNQLTWDFNAHAILEVEASVTGSSNFEIKIEVPEFEVNPLSQVPAVVRPFLGHLADDVTVGPYTIIDKQAHVTDSGTLVNIKEDLELFSFTNEEIEILNKVDFRLDDFDNDFVLLSYLKNPKEDELPLQIKKGNEHELRSNLKDNIEIGGFQLSYDSSSLSKTIDGLGETQEFKRSQTPLVIKISLDELVPLITDQAVQTNELRGAYKLPEIPGVSVPLDKIEFDFPISPPIFDWDGRIDVAFDPAKFIGAKSNPLSIGPWTTLDVNYEIFHADLFQDIGYDEDYEVTPHLYGKYVFDQDVVVWNGTDFNAVPAGVEYLVLMDDKSELEIFQANSTQDLSQLKITANQQLGAQVTSDVSLGLRNIGIDLLILNGTVKSAIIPGGDVKFAAVNANIPIANLGLDFIRETGTVDVIGAPDEFDFMVSNDGAASRAEDFRNSNGGSLLASNFGDVFMKVEGGAGTDGTATILSDGGDGGYAGAVDASQSVVDVIGAVNIGTYEVDAGHGGNGTAGQTFNGGRGGKAVVFDFNTTTATKGISVNNVGIGLAKAGDGGLAGNATAANGFAGNAWAVDARKAKVTDGDIEIVNDGSLTAIGGGSTASDILGGNAVVIDASTANGVVNILNRGEINAVAGVGGAGSGSAAGILTGSKDDAIVNSGSISVTPSELAISTQNGNDYVALQDGSHVTGLIDTGAGNDTVDISGQGQATRLILGTGDDTVNIQDSSSGIPIDFSGGGNNLLRLTGDNASINVAAVGGAGIDTLQLDRSGEYGVSVGGFDQLNKTGEGIWKLDLVEDVTTLGTTNIQEGILAIDSNGQNRQWTGNILGEGAVVKSGIETLTFQGFNTYSGGTVVAEGTLEGNTDNLQGNFLNNSRLLFSQSNNGTMLDDIVGTGSLEKVGGGNLFLAGRNSYSGGTIVSGGSIVGKTSAIQGDILNNATVHFTDDCDGTYSGNMSGSGLLVKTGVARVTLTGTNTYTGGTLINEGTLVGDTRSISGRIFNNALLEFSQDYDGVYEGVISGSGGLRITGTGTVVLNGHQTYTGDTVVNGGHLLVNGSVLGDTMVSGSVNGDMTVDLARLSGTGTYRNLTLQPGAYLQPGNSIGTLTVDGEYRQNAGSMIEAEISSAGTTPGVHSDLIDITSPDEITEINGGIIAVLADSRDLIDGRSFDPGQVYTILRSEKGIVGDGFDGLIDNLVLRDFNLIQNGYNIQIETLRIPSNLQANSTTANAGAVGRVLDEINAFATGDIGVVLDELALTAPGSRQAALNQMTGDIHVSAPRVGLITSSHLFNLVSEKMGSGGLAFRSNIYQSQPQPFGQPAGQTSALRPELGWFTGYDLSGNVDSDGNVDALNYSASGSTFAVGRTNNAGKRIGIIGSFGESTISGGSQHAEVNSNQLGAFVNADNGFMYTLATALFGYDEYETRRTINTGAVTSLAEGDYSGQSAAVYLERGLRFFRPTGVITPLMALQYDYIGQNDFTETGVGPLGLTVDDIDTHSLRSYIGGRFARKLDGGDGWLIEPSLRIAWIHEYLDAVSSTDVMLSGTNRFNTQGISLGRNWATFGTGLNFTRADRSIFLSYEAQFNERHEVHVGRAGLSFTW